MGRDLLAVCHCLHGGYQISWQEVRGQDVITAYREKYSPPEDSQAQVSKRGCPVTMLENAIENGTGEDPEQSILTSELTLPVGDLLVSPPT